MKEPETFLDSVRPLLRFNFIVGMGIYRHKNQTEIEYSSMKFYTVMFTIFNWIATYIGLTSLSEILNFDNSSPLAFNMYRLLVSTNSTIAIGSPFLVWLRRKEMKACLREMPILNETFEKVFGIKNEYKKEYVGLTCKVIAIVVVMVSVAICDMVLSLEVEINIENFQSSLTFISVAMTLHYPILIMLLLDVNFFTFSGYLAEKFRNLNACVLRLAKKPSASSPRRSRLFVVPRTVRGRSLGNKIEDNEVKGLMNDKYYYLHEIRKVHFDLCKLSRKINHAFAIQNLLSMAISFVMITGLLYTVYCAISWENFTLNRLKEIIPSLIWVAIYAFKIWGVNHSCWIVSDESEKTGEVIYELLGPRIDGELQKEVQEFAVQMLQNPVRFNACGFFTLDYTFVQGVIGSITTYLVILIQMSQVSELTSSESPGNDTEI